MRAARVAIVACLLMLAASVAAVDSQASARAVETRWKNCSQISRGRLGALHDGDGQLISKEFLNLNFAGVNGTGPFYTVNWSPCVLTNFLSSPTGPSFFTMTPGTGTVFDQVFIAGTTTVSTSPTDQLVTFTMPDVSSAVPMLTIAYGSTGSNDMAYVTAKCDPSASTKAVVTSVTRNGTAYNVTINTVEACARFPYTNQALPSGGVAALVICILFFVAEFGACVKYHRDNKNHSPLDEESMK